MQGILLWLQRCVFGTAVCVDPCEELVLRNNDPAANFDRGEAVASCQLISTGTRDAEHRSDLGDGEHQRQLVIACVGGMFHHSLPFLMRRAAYPSRTACAELAAALLRARDCVRVGSIGAGSETGTLHRLGLFGGAEDKVVVLGTVVGAALVDLPAVGVGLGDGVKEAAAGDEEVADVVHGAEQVRVEVGLEVRLEVVDVLEVDLVLVGIEDLDVRMGIDRADALIEGLRLEFVVVVGPSGSGKTTLLNMLGGMDSCTSGTIMLDGREVSSFDEKELTYYRRYDIGFVFQDPGSSFNPLMTIAENVAEPLIVHKKFSSVSDARKYVGDLLEMVQLPRAYMNRFPHELSGGQRQRASLARALALKPSLLIADEPTSALDVSVQAKVLELFKKLQAEIGFACLFITHDLAVVDMLADRIMVMHKGQIVEHGDADQIMQNPQNPYTQKLLASLPVPDPREQRKHREHLHELLAAQQ